MADVMLDARQDGGSYRRIEVITGQRQRRRWTAQEKARIVAESFEQGANISEVARRNGVARGLLTVWRHKLAAAAGANAPRLCAGPDRFRGLLRDGRRTGSRCVFEHDAAGDGLATRPVPRGDRD